MAAWLIEMFANHGYLVYALIIVAACIEGPVLSVVLGALLRLGYFSLWPVYLALMVGDLLGDVLWYGVGRYFGTPFVKRFGRYFSLNESIIERVKIIFHRYQDSILFISKLTTGLGLAIGILITAGIVRIPFDRYFLINTIGQFIWTGMVVGIGYYFSHWYLQVDALLGRVSVVALFVVLVMAFIGFKKYLRARLVP